MAVGLEAKAAGLGWLDTLSSRFDVKRVLGQGGMGVVVEAHHRQLDQPVAIKVLRPELAEHPEFVTSFIREARSAVKIKSEHVVRILDVSTLAAGAPYIVMELLEGSDLERLLLEHGPLEPEVAVDYVLQACEALAEAHARQMVHRDLKPANLFLTQRADGSPCIKVLDFGITKVGVTDESDPDFGTTTSKQIFGSPKYMSPEQMQASPDVDARTDIWALGAMLFELVEGRTAFVGDSLPVLDATVVHGSPRPWYRNVPPDLAHIVARCLTKNPEERYSDVAELADALAPLAGEEGRQSARRIRRALRSPGSERKIPSRAPPGSARSAMRSRSESLPGSSAHAVSSPRAEALPGARADDAILAGEPRLAPPPWAGTAGREVTGPVADPLRPRRSSWRSLALLAVLAVGLAVVLGGLAAVITRSLR